MTPIAHVLHRADIADSINNLFVGNSGNTYKDNDTVSYIYDMNDLVLVKTIIKYPRAAQI